jgi:hypothetical protein
MHSFGAAPVMFSQAKTQKYINELLDLERGRVITRFSTKRLSCKTYIVAKTLEKNF